MIKNYWTVGILAVATLQYPGNGYCETLPGPVSSTNDSITTPQTLLVIDPNTTFTRNSEGDILPLMDGSLALVYSRFTGGDADHSSADLAMRASPDDGRTWTEDRELLPNEGAKNVMSVSLLRLPSNEILLFYLRKDSAAGSCNMFVRRSNDELNTLSNPVRVTLRDGYHVVNNARVVRLTSGRILVPANIHSGFDDDATTRSTFSESAVPMVYYSDDDGQTWQKDKTAIRTPEKDAPIFQENGLVELLDGRVFMYIRTNQGTQYGCYSDDGGVTWTHPAATLLKSPLSPATIRRVPWSGHLMAVWNDHSGQHPFSPKKRTPLAVALSRDDGKTWGTSRLIETDPDGWYCYTSILFHRNHAILSYCAGDKKVGGLNRLKITSLPREWIDTSN